MIADCKTSIANCNVEEESGRVDSMEEAIKGFRKENKNTPKPPRKPRKGIRVPKKPVKRKDVKKKYFPTVKEKGVGRKSREELLDEAQERDFGEFAIRVTALGDLYVKRQYDDKFHKVHHKQILARMNTKGNFNVSDQDYKIYLGHLLGMTDEEAAVWGGVKITGKSKNNVRTQAWLALNKNDDVKALFRRIFDGKGITPERVAKIYDGLLEANEPYMDDPKHAQVILGVTDRFLDLVGMSPQKSLSIENKQTLDVRQILLRGVVNQEEVRQIAEECRNGLGIPPGVDFLQGMGERKALSAPDDVVEAKYVVKEAE